MNVRVYNHVQLAFWDLIIFALSRSRVIRRIGQWGYQLFSTTDFGDLLRNSILAGSAGFCFGIFLFFLALIAR